MILFVLIVACALHTASAKATFKSRVFSKANISEYYTFIPEIVYRSEKTKYPDAVWISIEAGSYNFTLKLQLNRNLFSQNFVSKHRLYNAEFVIKNHSKCFYQGTADGFPSWTALMSTCKGLRGTIAANTNEKQIHIEPLSNEKNSLKQLHVLFLKSKNTKPYKCGTSHGNTSGLSYTRNAPRATRQQPGDGHTRVIKLLVVNDWAQFQNQGEDVNTTVMRAIEIVNGIDYDFSSLGIRVILTQVITWANGNDIPISSDPATFLSNFANYKPNTTSAEYNAALLFTGVTMDSDTIGIAYKGTMCSQRLAVGVVGDYSSAISVSSTASHELGHILSMAHDTDQCQCNDTNGCIMTAELGSQPPSQWSDCSVNALVANLKNISSCLSTQELESAMGFSSSIFFGKNTPESNFPTPSPTKLLISTTSGSNLISSVNKLSSITASVLLSTVLNTAPDNAAKSTVLNSQTSTLAPMPGSISTASVCGNGIREDNEVCDCGPTKVCKDPCCDPTTCQLAKEVQCNEGACCIGCYFARSGVQCRPSSGECDVAEVCTGNSPGCPPDTFVRDGTPCAKGTAYCYNGLCPSTRDEQCKVFYGSKSKDGDSTCYRTYNMLGTAAGNCGQSESGDYFKCSKSDILCGSLQCYNAGSLFPAISSTIGIAFTVPHKCKSFVYSGDSNNIWMVKNGTKCDNNKICMNGKCSEIQNIPCPKGSNGIECSGKGVCSSNGICICSLGYVAPNCS